MICRCPNCGAANSLDSLVSDAEAAEVLKILLELDADIGKAAIRYIGLFRPAKSQLSWARTAKLLNELLPMIKAQEAARDGVCFPAPTEAWIHGFNETVNARDQGRLKTPLKSHGYLYEILAGWVGQPSAGNQTNQPNRRAALPANPSQTLTAAASLQGLKK
nr:MAG TPA: zinc-ribbon domain protein [Caudoviricetes sp.]